MQIKNPTNTAIEVQIKGTVYRIEAEGTLKNVPEDVARYWQESLHKFLKLTKDSSDSVKEEEVVEIPSPKVEAEVIDSEDEEDATDEVVEDVKEEATVSPSAFNLKK